MTTFVFFLRAIFIQRYSIDIIAFTDHSAHRISRVCASERVLTWRNTMTTPSKQRPAVGKKCGKSPQARYACFVIFHSANKNLMLSELGNSAEVVVNDDDDQTTVGKKCGKGPEVCTVPDLVLQTKCNAFQIRK